MTKLEYPPLFRLYELEKAEFVALGQRNLSLSIKTEPQTLAMHATHSDEKGLENLIFELYQDTAAQKRHQASPQFQKYATFAKNAIVNHKVGKVTIRKSKCRSL